MEKFGFVYIWRDRKHNRYYIGSHWGTEDDGYICSSTWMRNSYNRRPQDFKRRILSRVYTDRKELYEKEQEWFNLIKENELKIKYYNITNKVSKNWASKYSDEQKLKLKEKISLAVKEANKRPEVQEKLRLKYEKRRGTKLPEEVVEHMRQGMLKTMAEKYPLEKRKKTLKKDDPALIEIYRQKSIEMWANMNEEDRKSRIEKAANSNRGKPSKLRGKKQSKETIEKRAASLRGKPFSEERKEKLRQPRKKSTPEKRAKRSEMTKKWWDEHPETRIKRSEKMKETRARMKAEKFLV